MHSLLRSFSKLGLDRFPALGLKCASQASIQAGTPPVVRKLKPISKAMRAYIERVKAHEEKMLVESQQYQAGKRFLANIMGEDPASFSQEKVDAAIKYLLPSGLFEKAARPIMKSPEELFPAVKTAAFDVTGRPFHYLFYTKFFQCNSIQHETVRQIHLLNELEDILHSKRHRPKAEDKFDAVGTNWLTLEEMEKIINDKVPEDQYKNIINVLEVLLNHPMSAHAKDFLMQYRKSVENVIDSAVIPTPLEAPDGRLYIESKGHQKTSTANLVVISPGTGKILINKAHDITYFSDLQARQQVLFPLQVVDMLNKVDVEVVVHGGGQSGQAGSIRLALALALRSFVDSKALIKLQLAGLLNRDIRRKERKKIGKEGARRGYTWLKR